MYKNTSLNPKNMNAKEQSSKQKNSLQYNTISTFVLKIYNLLNDPQNAQAICWHEDGKSFILKSVTLFTNSVLPRYFRHSNYQSFIRQLNMYNFTKVKDANVHRFLNRYFLKEKEELLKYIKRKPEKKKRKSSYQSIESLRQIVFKDKGASLKENICSDKSISFRSGEILFECPSLTKMGKKMDLTACQDGYSDDFSTMIEPTHKWLANKEENIWSNIKSFKSINISMKIIEEGDEIDYDKYRWHEHIPRSNSNIMLLNPNITQNTLKLI